MTAIIGALAESLRVSLPVPSSAHFPHAIGSFTHVSSDFTLQLEMFERVDVTRCHILPYLELQVQRTNTSITTTVSEQLFL